MSNISNIGKRIEITHFFMLPMLPMLPIYLSNKANFAYFLN